ncbi:unnamed protein product [Lampetra planeri]
MNEAGLGDDRSALNAFAGAPNPAWLRLENQDAAIASRGPLRVGKPRDEIPRSRGIAARRHGAQQRTAHFNVLIAGTRCGFEGYRM